MSEDIFNLDEMILEFGTKLTLSGALFTDIDRAIILMLPDNKVSDNTNVEIPHLTLDDWNRILKQLDILEVEVLKNDGHGLKKAILRKSARQIEGRVSWKVFKRDGYKCRYCGNDDVPLTVDHLVLWEDGGPSIEENLITACSKCNKARGNRQYKEWLESDYYKEKSKKLDLSTIQKNSYVADTLSKISSRVHIPSRGKKKRF